MVHGRVRLTGPDDSAPSGPLDKAFAVIREEAGVPGEFPAEVLAAAREAARTPALPARDLTDLPFFTIDPVGSTDLDQAMHLERDGDGYRVRYAIADVPAFVAPGGPVDAEARRRGQTIYSPDQRTPLHPPVISEDAGSLLPGQVRPAYVWDLRLDAEGELTSSEVTSAMVRSVDRLDYEGVQAAVDRHADPRLELLRDVGERRLALEAERGGASLPLPEQEVVDTGDGYRLRFRPPVPAEDWNAQISLLTGMAGAAMMLAGEIGILRTMPAPAAHELARFHRQAAALGVRWPAEMQYGDFLRGLDRTNGRHLALIHEATRLFRGAGYTPFVGAVPEVAEHAAVAAPYAHVTAPLRRLVDRFGLVICAALCADREVPSWVREALPSLPEAMAASGRVASTVERACTDAVEVAVLRSRAGEVFDAVVVEVSENGDGCEVQLLDPPVLARTQGRFELGASVRVRLTSADVITRSVVLERVTD
jgi:exoribonuclease R